MAIRILLAEDHKDTADVTARLLRKTGHAVTVARNFGEAIQAGMAGFDLLLADIGLPGKNGIDVLIELRRHHSFRSIALTAYCTRAEVQKCIDAGFDAHILKPFELTEVLFLIAQVTSETTADCEGTSEMKGLSGESKDWVKYLSKQHRCEKKPPRMRKKKPAVETVPGGRSNVRHTTDISAKWQTA